MTDTDVLTAPPPSQRLTSAANLPKQPGLWRVISLLAVATALIISAVSVLQSRDASDVSVPERAPLALEQTMVTVRDLSVPPSSEIAVLGLADGESRRPFELGGTTVELPAETTAVIALTDAERAIVGMAVVPIDGDRTTVEISARSTAQALLVVSPGILRPNMAETFANVRVVENDAAFEKLVDALRVDPNISNPNAEAEQAYAEIADRLPAQDPEAEQGCDSVAALNAYTATGTCVQPKETGLIITNEQDRWALLFSGSAPFTDLCATVSPTGLPGDEVLIPDEQCVGESLIVAPGPVTNQGDGQQTIDQRVRAAVALNSLYDFAGPFADLVGGSASFTDDSVTHIRRNAREIVGSLSLLIDTNEAFATALDVPLAASTALDRHNASVTTTRFIIEAANTTALIPQRAPGDTGHVAILDFFQRSGERMISDRTEWRWEANAVGMVDFGAGS